MEPNAPNEQREQTIAKMRWKLRQDGAGGAEEEPPLVRPAGVGCRDALDLGAAGVGRHLPIPTASAHSPVDIGDVITSLNAATVVGRWGVPSHLPALTDLDPDGFGDTPSSGGGRGVKLQSTTQAAAISDVARARIALTLPVLKGILFALQSDRVVRLGGHPKITLADLAREYREGSGDCGICFEYAVHDSLRSKDPGVHPLISTVLEDYCGIKSGAESILFGAEKSGALSLIETSSNALDNDSRVLSGKVGQPAKLLKNWDPIKKALRSVAARDRLPASIRGLWKADLFLGSAKEGRWVGSTLKLNKADFEGAAGLRIGIYPETKKGESPTRDDRNNLVLCPLPYDANFMEIFYSSFFLVKQFLDADAKVPKPVALPNSADRFVAQQLEDRRDYAVLDVLDAMYELGQPGLTHETVVGDSAPDESAPVDAIAPVPEKATS